MAIEAQTVRLWSRRHPWVIGVIGASALVGVLSVTDSVFDQASTRGAWVLSLVWVVAFLFGGLSSKFDAAFMERPWLSALAHASAFVGVQIFLGIYDGLPWVTIAVTWALLFAFSTYLGVFRLRRHRGSSAWTDRASHQGYRDLGADDGRHWRSDQP